MKVIALSTLVLFFSAGAFAADSLDGCGLGWQVTDGKTYTATTTRGTTNAFVPPTFGMTTGTIGCDQLDVGANDKEAANFVATNYEVLKTELAKGEGVYVQAMADAFGCTARTAELGKAIQNNYSSVVSAAQSDLEMFKNIRQTANSVCI